MRPSLSVGYADSSYLIASSILQSLLFTTVRDTDTSLHGRFVTDNSLHGHFVSYTDTSLQNKSISLLTSIVKYT